MIDEFLFRSSGMILFLHLISATIWVGGMIVIRFAVHPSMLAIEDKKLRIARTVDFLGNFFAIIKVFIWILFLTALALVYLKYDFKFFMIHIKESLWILMAIIFFIIVQKHSKAKKALEQDDIESAVSFLAPISKILIPANIVIGLLAILFGVVLRGI